MGALEAYAWEWGSALIRWLHVTAAIAWIGGSFFFMHLDASFGSAPATIRAIAGISWHVHGGGFYRDEQIYARAAVAARANSSGPSGNRIGPG